MKLSTARKQQIARTVREEHGMEITPDEAESQLSSAYAKIREHLVANGHPEFGTMSDEELTGWVRESLG